MIRPRASITYPIAYENETCCDDDGAFRPISIQNPYRGWCSDKECEQEPGAEPIDRTFRDTEILRRGLGDWRKGKPLVFALALCIDFD